uniref:Uncharacterized protein n=1 Tax=Tanacetum cinerariifolium TaxID=118510 RepID=A0A699VR17_TANCI|nr:hypothetical protein [Tanacetum cinerariifolium]
MVKDKEKKCNELEAKCETAMENFDKNLTVMVLHQKIVSLLAQLKDRQDNLDKMLLESQKWAGYKEVLSTLDSKVATLEG